MPTVASNGRKVGVLVQASSNLLHDSRDAPGLTPHPGSQKTVHMRSGQQVTKMKSRVREQSRILCQTIGWMKAEDVRNKTTK